MVEATELKQDRMSCSCALAMDCTISVWDVRRPYIPFLAFHEHRDVTTCIAWQGNPSSLLSVGKDNTLYCHSVEDAIHPIENMNPVALSINPKGFIVAARPKNDNSNYKLNFKQRRQRKSSANDSFGPVFSLMNMFEEAEESLLSTDYIIEFAINYRLSGKSFSEICEHNAAVARRLKKHQIAATWQIIQILYGAYNPTSDSNQGVTKDEMRSETTAENDSKHVRHVSGEGSGDTNPGTGGISADDIETETDDTDTPDMKLMHIASGVNVGNDYFFGDDELALLPFDYDNLNNLDVNNEWMLPNEAFQPRRDIIYRPATPPDDYATNSTQKEEARPQETEDIRADGSEFVMASSLRLSDSDIEPPPPLDLTPLVTDVLHHYATSGDVQTSVSLIIVLGDRIKNLVDEATVEHWFLSYIEILHRLSLWITATEIIQYSGMPHIQNMNQQSTSIRLNCGVCNQSISYGKNFCKKCSAIPSRCAICHCIVQSLFVWCQDCSHGGHLAHMCEWFQENTSCPTGCGHQCEFT